MWWKLLTLISGKHCGILFQIENWSSPLSSWSSSWSSSLSGFVPLLGMGGLSGGVKNFGATAMARRVDPRWFLSHSLSDLFVDQNGSSKAISVLLTFRISVLIRWGSKSSCNVTVSCNCTTCWLFKCLRLLDKICQTSDNEAKNAVKFTKLSLWENSHTFWKKFSIGLKEKL